MIPSVGGDGFFGIRPHRNIEGNRGVSDRTGTALGTVVGEPSGMRIVDDVRLPRARKGCIRGLLLRERPGIRVRARAPVRRLGIGE